MAKQRTSHSPQFKAKAALEATREAHTISELGRKFSVHPSQPDPTVEEACWNACRSSSSIRDHRPEDAEAERVPELYQQIGRLQVELEWLKKKT